MNDVIVVVNGDVKWGCCVFELNVVLVIIGDVIVVVYVLVIVVVWLNDDIG